MKEIVLNTHSIFGIAIFALGMIQILLPKKGILHRYLGRTYVICWFPLILSGAYLGAWPITALGSLGLYCTLTGWRFAATKKKIHTLGDKILIISGMILVITIMIGTAYLFALGHTEFGIIMSVFSAIFGLYVLTDAREILFGQTVRRLSAEPINWLFEHYTRMYISMITALTAFSAIQQPFSNQIVNWLWPSVAGTIAIVVLGEYYRKKYNVGKKRGVN